MASLQGKWIKLEQKGTGPGPRSSHTATVVGQKAYVFGGELIARKHVDNNLYVFNLKTQTWSKVDATGDKPPALYGPTIAAIGEKIYLFGGRNEQQKHANILYAFDTRTNNWKILSNGATGPTPRSYHSMAVDDSRVYIFGGSSHAGRSKELWEYNIADQIWTLFPKPDEKCSIRGGPGLFAIEGKIWVVSGFNEYELDDVHYFDTEDVEWTEADTTGHKPDARSVFYSASVKKYIIVYGGELEPSDLMHEGAGDFSSEVYGLNTETLEWKKFDDGVGSRDHPGPRGWGGSAAASFNGKDGMLVFGGNSPTNERLDDIYFFAPNLP